MKTVWTVCRPRTVSCASNAWTAARIGAARGEPDSSDPDAVAAALQRQYERYGTLIDRTIRQEELSPALAEGARGLTAEQTRDTVAHLIRSVLP